MRIIDLLKKICDGDMTLDDEIEIFEPKGKLQGLNFEKREYDLTDFHENYKSSACMLYDLGERMKELTNKVNELVNEINKIEENMDI